MQSFAQQLFIGYFGKKFMNKLAKKGVTPVNSCTLPDANGCFANGETGYGINDNGTYRLLTFREIDALAK